MIGSSRSRDDATHFSYRSGLWASGLMVEGFTCGLRSIGWQLLRTWTGICIRRTGILIYRSGILVPDQNSNHPDCYLNDLDRIFNQPGWNLSSPDENSMFILYHQTVFYILRLAPRDLYIFIYLYIYLYILNCL